MPVSDKPFPINSAAKIYILFAYFMPREPPLLVAIALNPVILLIINSLCFVKIFKYFGK